MPAGLLKHSLSLLDSALDTRKENIIDELCSKRDRSARYLNMLAQDISLRSYIVAKFLHVTSPASSVGRAYDS